MSDDLKRPVDGFTFTLMAEVDAFCARRRIDSISTKVSQATRLWRTEIVNPRTGLLHVGEHAQAGTSILLAVRAVESGRTFLGAS
jgi:hypothetical protein